MDIYVDAGQHDPVVAAVRVRALVDVKLSMASQRPGDAGCPTAEEAERLVIEYGDEQRGDGVVAVPRDNP